MANQSSRLLTIRPIRKDYVRDKWKLWQKVNAINGYQDTVNTNSLLYTLTITDFEKE